MSDLADSAISIAVDNPAWRQLVKVNGKTLRPFTWIYLALPGLKLFTSSI
jgi:hypothetical protein